MEYGNTDDYTAAAVRYCTSWLYQEGLYEYRRLAAAPIASSTGTVLPYRYRTRTCLTSILLDGPIRQIYRGIRILKPYGSSLVLHLWFNILYSTVLYKCTVLLYRILNHKCKTRRTVRTFLIF